jgi:asparagine synthase (glutamine-hydrolysing)
MCGIAGFWSEDAALRAEAGRSLAVRMADAIRHRGPDSAGSWSDEDTGIALAQRRLAIVDLSEAGAQPMRSASGRYVIVYNGELYNHPELRRELTEAGAAPAWRGHSDTETLLAAIDAWGFPRALERAIGMFAFALWDAAERSLVLARDRMGEKPLYYGWVGRSLVFASELKALRAFPGFNPPIDRRAVASYLRYSYVPGPHTIYGGVSKLPPASWLRLTAPSPVTRPEPRPYWSLTDVIAGGASSRAMPVASDAADELERVLGRVVASQMLSDVPLGAFLSGGIDSSLVTALMQKHSAQPVRTFSIGFAEARFNEADHARAVARHLGTDHTEFTVTEAEALAVVPELPRIFDEPFADPSQIPTILLSRLTRQRVTVAMSGDGGDEVFGGYNRYLYAPDLWRRLGALPAPARSAVAAAAGGIQRLSNSAGGSTLNALVRRLGLPVTTADRLSKFGSAIGNSRDFEGFYREIVSTWTTPGEALLVHEEAPSLLDDPRRRPLLDDQAELMMALDALTYLPDDILVKVDRSAMSASLETRAPFLDARIVEHAWRLPRSAKIQGRTGKHILRQVLDRHVPRALVERPKQGFAIPLDAWLRGGLRDWAESLLERRRLDALGLRPEALRRHWQGHIKGRDNAGARLWSVLMLLAWQEEAGRAGTRQLVERIEVAAQ